MSSPPPIPDKPPGTPSKASEMVSEFGWLWWLFGAVGMLLPCGAWFVDYSPPFLPPLGTLFFPVVAAALYVYSCNREKRFNDQESRAVKAVVIAVVFLIVYWIAIQYVTVVPPGEREAPRRQIGFYMFEWSLRPEAVQMIKDLSKRDPAFEVSTPNDLMNILGVWGGRGRTDEIWKLWTIMAAGWLLVVLYMLSLGAWVYVLAILSKYFRGKSRVLAGVPSGAS